MKIHRFNCGESVEELRDRKGQWVQYEDFERLIEAIFQIYIDALATAAGRHCLIDREMFERAVSLAERTMDDHRFSFTYKVDEYWIDVLPQDRLHKLVSFGEQELDFDESGQWVRFEDLERLAKAILTIDADADSWIDPQTDPTPYGRYLLVDRKLLQRAIDVGGMD